MNDSWDALKLLLIVDEKSVMLQIMAVDKSSGDGVDNDSDVVLITIQTVPRRLISTHGDIFLDEYLIGAINYYRRRKW